MTEHRSNGQNNHSRGSSRTPVFNGHMQARLLAVFILILAAFVVLIVRLYHINRDNGEEYKKQVLAQQSYDSREIPFKRGTITDAKGTVLANSELVYNVIVDAYQMNSGKTDETTGESVYIPYSLDALEDLGVDRETIAAYVKDHPDSRYYVAKKNLSYEDYTAYQEQIQAAADAVSKINEEIAEERKGSNDETKLAQLQAQLKAAQQENEKYTNIQGVWFEPAYIRNYPEKTLAADVIGFSNNANVGNFGLEEYYNDILNGTPGREYGYLNSTNQLERTTIDATDGENLVLTLDANIQSIVEKYLKKFEDEQHDKVRAGYGANNVGCIIQDVNNGEILAMASTPTYDLSDPYDLSRIVGMPKLNDKDQPTDEYMTQADVDALTTQEEQSRYLNALWQNFCISTYYEPGSVAKPFTLAAGLESGKMTGDESYYCGGSLTVGGWPIKCHNTNGDGMLTVDQAIERSCNVALMQMAMQTGKNNFCKFQRIFNFGLKTNIDLADEARTDDMLISLDRMGEADLATNSFGQNFDVTMIQMITAFSSLINGGNYYEPHMVSRITSPSGATVKNIEPRLLKKTVSEETSAKIREATIQVCEGASGTGRKARPAGYRIGGKTGTAETLPRGNGEYIVSFMGYAPADDPQIAIYVVIDRMNDAPQDQTAKACLLVHDILTEVLPYLGIYMTEPLSEAEEEQLRQLDLQNTYAYGASNTQVNIRNNWDSDGDGKADCLDANGDGVQDYAMDTDGDGITDAADTDGDGVADMWDSDHDGVIDTDQNPNQEETVDKPWTSYEVDPATGYYIEPGTGKLVDPDTGYVYDDTTMGTGSEAAGQTPEGVIAAENGTREDDGTTDGDAVAAGGDDAGQETGQSQDTQTGTGTDTAGSTGNVTSTQTGNTSTATGTEGGNTTTANTTNTASTTTTNTTGTSGTGTNSVDANGNGIADDIEDQLLNR